ncbi:hypothetical protein FBU30_001581 [Linnemannia zychae]|nr:hypothetical protein FBU30_001581 [Linnemannia zychae]
MFRVYNVFQGVAETIANATTTVNNQLTTGLAEISQSSHRSQTSYQANQAQTQAQNVYQNARHNQAKDQHIKERSSRKEMLRQARQEKQPIGRSTGLATLSNSDRLEHDDEMGVSGSTTTPENQLDNSPAASIHLMSPGPGGPLIFDLEHPFDIDAMYTDKMKFDWLES